MEYSISLMNESSKRLGKDVETLVFIGDMKNLAIKARRTLWLVKGYII